MEEIDTSQKSDFQVESDLKSPYSPAAERPPFVDNEVYIPMNQPEFFKDADMINF